MPSLDRASRSRSVIWLMRRHRAARAAWIVAHIKDDLQAKNKLKDKCITDVYALAKREIYSKDMESYLAIDADPDEFKEFILNKQLSIRNELSVRDMQLLLPYTFNLNTSISSAVNQQMLKAKEPKPRTKKRKKPGHLQKTSTTKSKTAAQATRI